MYEREYGDDLLSKDKRLKYKWVWSRIASRISEEEIKKWTYFQCSVSNSLPNWELGATQWGGGDGVNYEATIEYEDNYIASKKGFKTRIEAQIGAEKLLRDWLNSQIKKLKNG